MRPPSPLRAAAIAIVIGASAACGGGGEGGESGLTAPQTSAPTATAADTTAPGTTARGPIPAASAAGGRPVPAALDFSSPTVGGGDLDLRSYAGSPVAFWFWAPY